MSKDGSKYARAWLIAVLGITFLVWLFIQIDNFRKAHTVWFWLIVALAIIAIIIILLRNQIINWYYDWRFKQANKPKNNPSPKNNENEDNKG